VPDAWVVNASPLIALAHAGQLELLEKLPVELVVPEAVAEEILAGPDDPARRALASGWGPRRGAAVPQNIAEWSLGKGESAVLALAFELKATAVLDDHNARRCAKALSVPVIGTFGVIIRAKKQGLISAAATVIRSVIDAGLYYDDQSIRTLLASVGERWS
jgi:predicted nucleic acid-binding protein